MAAAWPGSLPQAFLVDTYQPGLVDSASEFGNEHGPASRRQRFKVGSKVDRAEIGVTPAQWQTLVVFFETTCAGGVFQFTMFDPFGGADRMVRFAEPPAPTQIAPRYFRVTLALEVLP